MWFVFTDRGLCCCLPQHYFSSLLEAKYQITSIDNECGTFRYIAPGFYAYDTAFNHPEGTHYLINKLSPLWSEYQWLEEAILSIQEESHARCVPVEWQKKADHP